MRINRVFRLFLVLSFLGLLPSCTLGKNVCRGEDIHEEREDSPTNRSRLKYLDYRLRKAEAEAKKQSSLGRYDAAVKVYKESIGELRASDYDNFPRTVLRFHDGLEANALKGSYYLKLDAMVSYQKSVEICEENNLFNLACLNSLLLASCYHDLGALEDAEIALRKGVEFADRAPTGYGGCLPVLAIQARKRLLEFYQEHGRTREAEALAGELAGLQECPSSISEEKRKELIENLREEMRALKEGDRREK